MIDTPSHQSGLRPWHELVEHYTPDGVLGRLLLAIGSTTTSVATFLLAVFCFTRLNLLWYGLGSFLAGVGLTAAIVSILMLWPIYLSLIGNVDSARSYPATSRRSTSTTAVDPEDAIEVLKEQYALGNVPQSEFERRLDTLLAATDESSSNHRTPHGRTQRTALGEAERN